jgi:uncharacterized protein
MLLFFMLIHGQYLADIAAHAPGATKAQIKEWNEGFGDIYPTAAAIARDRALHLGTYVAFVVHNLRDWTSVLKNTIPFIPDTVGLMLLGMAGYKSGFLTGAWSRRAYAAIATLLIGASLGLFGYAAWTILRADFDPLV